MEAHIIEVNFYLYLLELWSHIFAYEIMVILQFHS